MLVRSCQPMDNFNEEKEETEWEEAGRDREDEQKKVAGGKAEGR